jgi:hypothetical protein
MIEHDPLAALQGENARLIALLEDHGVEWRLPPQTTPPEPAPPVSVPEPFSSEQTGHGRTSTGHDPDINHLSVGAWRNCLTHCQEKKNSPFWPMCILTESTEPDMPGHRRYLVSINDTSCGGTAEKSSAVQREPSELLSNAHWPQERVVR